MPLLSCSHHPECLGRGEATSTVQSGSCKMYCFAPPIDTQLHLHENLHTFANTHHLEMAEVRCTLSLVSQILTERIKMKECLPSTISPLF